MLPRICDIAQNHNLIFNPKTFGRKETRCKCPFCEADAHRRKKYYLSLNTQSQVYKCWYCKASGGVFRFIAELDGITEQEAIAKYRKDKGNAYKLHPAEKLSLAQLQLLGYQKVTQWAALRKRDMTYYKRTCTLIWQEWRRYCDGQRRWAFAHLLVGALTKQRFKTLAVIREREKQIDASLLDDVIAVYRSKTWPQWANETRQFVLHMHDPKRFHWHQNQ